VVVFVKLVVAAVVVAVVNGLSVSHPSHGHRALH